LRLLRLRRRGRGASPLGPLESRIMDVLWDAGEPLPVRAVHGALTRAREPLAYSTVKAVLTNLTAKGHLRRTARGHANYFTPVETRDAFRARTVRAVIDSLLENHREPLIAHLVDRVAEREDDLRELEALIARTRAKRGRHE
jgi:predicted transcriptional regulator